MSLYACVKICAFKFDWILFVCFSKSSLRIALVENIPEGLNYSENAPFHLSLFQGWMNLLSMARKSVDIVSSHWDLNHSHPSACQVSCVLCVCDDCTYAHPKPSCACLPFSSSRFLFLSTAPHGIRTLLRSHVGAVVDPALLSSCWMPGFQGQTRVSSVHTRLSMQHCWLGHFGGAVHAGCLLTARPPDSALRRLHARSVNPVPACRGIDLVNGCRNSP